MWSSPSPSADSGLGISSTTWLRCRFCRPTTPMPTRFCSRHMKRIHKRDDQRKMSDQTKHENGHGSFERQDLQVSGILYFLLSLVVVTALCLVGLRGVYAFLDHREKALQPA